MSAILASLVSRCCLTSPQAPALTPLATLAWVAGRRSGLNWTSPLARAYGGVAGSGVVLVGRTKLGKAQALPSRSGSCNGVCFGVPAGSRRTMSDGYTHFRGNRNMMPLSQRLQQPKYILIGVTIVALPGIYWATHQDKVPYSGRRRFMDLSVADEHKLGAREYRTILNNFEKKKKVLPADHPSTQRVRRIGLRIAQVSGCSFNWEFNVVDSDECNAFVLPGGKCVVYTGLLKLFKDDNELATVLAHEIGHAVARHGAEQISNTRFFGFYRIILVLAVGSDFGGLANAAFSVVLDLPYSRLMESEADQIGAVLMTRACFDPRAGPVTFKKLGELNKSRGIKYLSTHPPPDSRITDLQKELPKRMEEYHKHCTHNHLSTGGSREQLGKLGRMGGQEPSHEGWANPPPTEENSKFY